MSHRRIVGRVAERKARTRDVGLREPRLEELVLVVVRVQHAALAAHIVAGIDGVVLLEIALTLALAAHLLVLSGSQISGFRCPQEQEQGENGCRRHSSALHHDVPVTIDWFENLLEI